MGELEWGVLLRPEFRSLLVKGIFTTLQLSAASIIGGMLLGALIAFARLSRWRALSFAATAYVEFTRTVPLVVHVMFWYFGAAELLPEDAKRWLYARDTGFYAAVVALVLYSSAFISEDLRSGIRGIPRGQSDAAHSLGFGYLKTFRLVILPQALRATVPPLLGQALTLTKNTTVALMIGVPELAYVTRAVQSATFQTISIYAFAILFFLLVALALTGLSRLYQRRVLGRAGTA
jgi:polar amino acid transport system permease protein